MFLRVLILLMAAVFICYWTQVSASDTYVAEFMVKSNITMDAWTIQAKLNSTLPVAINTTTIQITILQIQPVSECEQVGDNITCRCFAGYVWTNDVCYDSSCCTDADCRANVTHIYPLCIPKVKVRINGTIKMNTKWADIYTEKLNNSLMKMNGYENLNTKQRENDIVNFEADFSARFETARLQETLNSSEIELGLNVGSIRVDTAGMVSMETPETMVCYQSSPELKCTFAERTSSAGWSFKRSGGFVALTSGSVSRISQSATEEVPSWVSITLVNVTSNWAGTFKCGFTEGSIQHTAQGELTMALLPDDIQMSIQPQTVDCTVKPKAKKGVKVTAIILNTTEEYRVTWLEQELHPIANNEFLHYTVDAPELINCMSSEVHDVKINFRNQKGQTKSVSVDIPVLYAGTAFCEKEVLGQDIWPKTPTGTMVVNQMCPGNRTGSKTRNCSNTAVWEDVYNYCISVELNKVYQDANNFKQGLEATQEMAERIFSTLKNILMIEDSSEESYAGDLSVSVSILSTMADATGNINITDEVFPDLIAAASNMLDLSWSGASTSHTHDISSKYVKSLESLVHNIKVNDSRGFNSSNVRLAICNSQTGSQCNSTGFGVSVSLNKSSGIVKTMVLRNLMDKLNNNFNTSDTSSLLVTATVQGGNGTPTDIFLEFPNEYPALKPLCVFWNTTRDEWSTAGCKLQSADVNRTVCQCDHLTPFSTLMSSRIPKFSKELDVITYVGLGVSICSLLLFLVIEALVWSAVVKSNLSHFRHTALVNISVCLLLAHCSFLASSFPKRISYTWCLALALCKHFFLLAMFCWMLCLSIILSHQLIFVFNPLRKRVIMFFSSIIGYVLPILIVGSTYVYYEYTGQKNLYLKKDLCWLNYESPLRGSLHAFLLPIGTVILTNLFSMTVIIVTLIKSSGHDVNRSDKDTIKSILKAVVFLTPAFGVTWIFGFFQILLDESDSESDPDVLVKITQYTFTILNSFQGFFILLTGVFAEQKVREELLKIMFAKVPSRAKSESMKKMTTQQTLNSKIEKLSKSK